MQINEFGRTKKRHSCSKGTKPNIYTLSVKRINFICHRMFVGNNVCVRHPTPPPPLPFPQHISSKSSTKGHTGGKKCRTRRIWSSISICNRKRKSARTSEPFFLPLFCCCCVVHGKIAQLTPHKPPNSAPGGGGGRSGLVMQSTEFCWTEKHNNWRPFLYSLAEDSLFDMRKKRKKNRKTYIGEYVRIRERERESYMCNC